MANPLMFRYPPNYRFAKGSGFSTQKEVEKVIETFGESVTDKESYRLSLAGKRGALSSRLGSSSSGAYSFPDGKYNPENDFSYLRRKDLSIVEIDNYIQAMKSKLEISDEKLRKSIEEQIENAENLKKETAKKENIPEAHSGE